MKTYGDGPITLKFEGSYPYQRKFRWLEDALQYFHCFEEELIEDVDQVILITSAPWKKTESILYTSIEK